jgi:hypothetical protein
MACDTSFLDTGARVSEDIQEDRAYYICDAAFYMASHGLFTFSQERISAHAQD